ncbi:TSUP family transporter [Hoeflea sp. TYP-13]|uniref:TSUP family transporter n=1 Tax=Hoeflea sp. TYP-13 TaxID=3230023 RepID=UPI0034C5BF7D
MPAAFDGNAIRFFPGGTVGFVPGKILKLVFAGVATLIALKMLFNRQSRVISNTLPSKITSSIVGFTIGFLSTFMGIGGGNINNLFMTAYGQTMQQAVATSAGLGILIAIPGAIGNLAAGWGLPSLPAYTFGYIYVLPSS